jgi:hypothetical protein
MAAQGHEDQFRPPSLTGGSRLDKLTFAGMGGNEEDAPKPLCRMLVSNFGPTQPLFVHDQLPDGAGILSAAGSQ